MKGKKKTNRGLIELLIILLIAVFLLSLFGFSLKDTTEKAWNSDVMLSIRKKSTVLFERAGEWATPYLETIFQKIQNRLPADKYLKEKIDTLGETATSSSSAASSTKKN